MDGQGAAHGHYGWASACAPGTAGGAHQERPGPHRHCGPTWPPPAGHRKLQDFRNDYSFILPLRDTLAEYDPDPPGAGGTTPQRRLLSQGPGGLGRLSAGGKAGPPSSLHSPGTEEGASRSSCKSGQYLYDQRNELLDLSFRNARIVRNSFKEMKVDKEAGTGGSGAGHGEYLTKMGRNTELHQRVLLGGAGYR